MRLILLIKLTYMKKLKKDILFSEMYYGMDAIEYFRYRFEDLSDKARKTYVGRREVVRALMKLETPETRELFRDKYKTYKRFEKYYKRDTLREFDTLLLDLRDYLDEAANPRLYPQGTEPKKKRKKRSDGQAPEAPPQPVTCITMHQYETWSKYTGAIGGMIGNYMKYVEGKQSK